MGKLVPRGRIFRLLVVTGIGVAAVAMLSMSASARSGRSPGHVRRGRSSLLSVRYLSHNRHNQLVPGMGSTRRHVKHGPLGPQRSGRASRAAMIGARRAARAARSGTIAATATRASRRPATCSLPSAPGSPGATGGTNHAAVSWSAANGNGNAITAYVVTAVNGTTPENAQGEPASATTATLTGLAGGNYTFTIFAQNSCGNGPAATTTSTTVTGGTTYASLIISLEPRAYFRLGEPAGSLTAADSSGNGLLAGIDTNSGIQFGAAGALPSDAATSVNDTDGEWVATEPTPNDMPVANQPRTVLAWIKPIDQSCRFVLGFGQNGNDLGYDLGECNNSIYISAYNDDQTWPTPEQLDDGFWHMIAVTYDGTNATAYLDGRTLGTRQFANPLSTATGPLELGAWTGLCCNNWTYGGLQDETVYGTALTATQIASLFSASGYAAPTTPGSPTASSTTNQTATVKWTASTAPGTTVTGYLVTAKLSGVAEQTIGAPGTATSATLSGLPGGSYTFSIVPVDPYGSGTAATTAAVSVGGSTTSYGSTVLADHPTVFYRLDEPPGTGLMADSAGANHFGHYANSCLTLGVAGPLATDPSTGASSSACNNIGTGGRLTTLPSGFAARTMQAWIKPSDGGCRYFMGYGNQYLDGEFGLGNCANSVLVRLYSDDHSFYSPRTIDDGDWHLVTIESTYSPLTGNAVSAYLDSQLLGTVYTNQLNTQANTPLSIGSDPSDCCYYGAVADAAVFPTALTQASIAAELSAAGDGVPSAPTGVAATGAANKATITWTASTAPGTSVTSYVVTELSGGVAQQSIAVSGSSTRATIDSLASGSYTFSVVAYDTYGKSTAGTTSSSTAVTGAAKTYASDTIASAPALYYRLGETGTGIMADSSGHGTIGAYDLNSTTQGVSGAIKDGSDLAASQNGGGFMGEAGGSAAIPAGDGPRTLEAWIKPSDAYCGRDIAGFGNTATDQGFTLAECSNDLTVDAYNDTKPFYTPRILDDGSWHFVAATYTDVGGVDQVTAYLDGASLGTKSFTGTLSTPPSSTLWIGAGPNDCCGSFYGGIDEVAVFPTALSAATIAGQFALSENALPTAPTGVSASAGTNEATVDWTAATSPDPLTGYLVTARAGATVKGSVAAPPSATSATISGLPSGTAYTLTVVALDAYGSGPAATSTAVTPTGTATTYQSTVLGDGPVADYTLAEPSGSEYAADSSGDAMTADYNVSSTTFGNPGPIPTDPATSVSDNGSLPVAVDSIVPGNKLPAANEPRTMVAWVKPADANCRYAMAFGDTNTGEGFGMSVCPHSVTVTGWGDDQTFNTATNIDDGNWHQIVISYDGTNDAAYVDGNLIGSAPPAQVLNTPSDTTLYLGAGPQQAGNYYYGGLADTAVFPTALTPSQVSALFSASGYGVPTAPSNVTATPGNNDATISWNPATAPNATVTAYVVTALQGGTTAANAVATSGGAASVTLHGLTAGQAYTFKVVAYDTYGGGPSATSSSVSPTGSNTPVQFAQQVISDGAVAYYRLGETTGNVAADSSGNGVLGAYNTNSVTLGTAGALTHDPSTSITDNGSYAVATPALPSALPTGGAARSAGIWFKTSAGGCEYLMGYGVQSSDEGFSLNECSGSTTSLTVDGWGETVSVTDSTALDNGAWHFLVATYSGGNVSFYVDGTQVGTAQTFGTVLSTPANTSLYIGSELNDYGGFTGSLQDAAVFSSALSSAQVSTLYGDR